MNALRSLRFVFAALPFTVFLAAEPPPAPTAAQPNPSAPLSAYSGVGSIVVQSNHLAELGWTDAQINAFLEGARIALQTHRYATDGASHDLYQAMAQRIQEIKDQEGASEGDALGALKHYEKEVRERFHLQQADDGLCYGIQVNGAGARPTLQDKVIVSLSAIASDGATPLPSLSRDRMEVMVGAMLPGLAHGLQMMAAGSQALFMLPPDLSFADRAWPEGIEKGTPLFFKVTLLKVIPAGAPL